MKERVPEHLHRAVEFDKGYFDVPLKESQEHLVHLPTVFAQEKLTVSFDVTSIGKFPKLYWVREGLVGPLIAAAYALQKKKFSLHFVYGLRSYEQQQLMFEHFVQETLKKYPSLSKERVLELAGVYAACNPATAAHMAGAAVDVLLKHQDGSLVDLGAEYLEDSANSETDTPLLSRRARDNRKVLKDTMEAVGFANYPFEFWHYSLGDRIAAYIQNKPHAVYGPVEFDIRDGIKYFYTEKEQFTTFTVDHLFHSK